MQGNPYHSMPTAELRTAARAARDSGDSETFEVMAAELDWRADIPEELRRPIPTDGYEPDPASVDALVEHEGADAPPSPAEEAIAGFEPVDADEVRAKLAEVVDLAESFLVAGTGTVEDRIRLFVALGDATGQKGSLTTVKKVLGERLPADLDGPVEVDGRWWKAGRSKRTTGWDKAGLRSAVNKVVMADPDPEAGEPVVALVDTTTGEPVPGPTAAVAVDRLWKFVDVATGRTKVLREGAGIEPDEYARVEWTDVIEEIVDRG